MPALSKLKTLTNLTRIWFALSLIPILSVISCADNENARKIAEINDRIENEFAPDKRVAVYNIEIVSDRNAIRIKGETDQPEALEQLKEELERFNTSISHEVSLLPDTSIGNHP